MLNLETIMSTDLITTHPEASLLDARSLMRSHNIHHLPVVNDRGVLVGLLTHTNVLAATDSILRDEENRLDDKEILVEDIMVTKVATVDIDASIRDAALFLEKHRIGCLPVLKRGRLVGIITDTDFVAIAINLLEQLEEGEPWDANS